MDIHLEQNPAKNKIHENTKGRTNRPRYANNYDSHKSYRQIKINSNNPSPP